jgi:hypothetical protein
VAGGMFAKWRVKAEAALTCRRGSAVELNGHVNARQRVRLCSGTFCPRTSYINNPEMRSWKCMKTSNGRVRVKKKEAG